VCASSVGNTIEDGRLVVDEAAVYFIAPDGCLMRADLESAGARALTGPFASPGVLSAGGGFIWVKDGCDLWRVAVSSGKRDSVFRRVSGVHVHQVLVNERRVYFEDLDAKGLWTAELDGNDPRRIAAEGGVPLVALDGDIYWREPVWAWIWKIHANGGEPVRVARLSHELHELTGDTRWDVVDFAITPCGIYCAGRRALFRRSLVTADLARFADTDYDASVLAADATHLYWASYDGIARIPLAGGEPQLIEVGCWPVSQIAVTARHMIWSGQGAGVYAKRLSELA
jgi:hypothetical protein